MKASVLTFLLIATLVHVNAQTFTNAVDYNDFIVEEQTKVGEKILAINAAFGEEAMTKEGILPILEDLLSTAKASVGAIKKLGPFEKETQLKQAALELFQFYVKIIDVDYREMINLIYGSALDDAALARLNEILEKVQADEAVYDENFQASQNAFAERYDIELQVNELQGEMDKD